MAALVISEQRGFARHLDDHVTPDAKITAE